MTTEYVQAAWSSTGPLFCVSTELDRQGIVLSNLDNWSHRIFVERNGRVVRGVRS